jgi:hypothetical protein
MDNLQDGQDSVQMTDEEINQHLVFLKILAEISRTAKAYSKSFKDEYNNAGLLSVPDDLKAAQSLLDKARAAKLQDTPQFATLQASFGRLQSAHLEAISNVHSQYLKIRFANWAFAAAYNYILLHNLQSIIETGHTTEQDDTRTFVIQFIFQGDEYSLVCPEGFLAIDDSIFGEYLSYYTVDADGSSEFSFDQLSEEMQECLRDASSAYIQSLERN